MKNHAIAGGGGAKLHLLESGNPSGRAILLIHGFSEKPREGYDNSKYWADDVNAAIQSLDLDRPVLCGWSFGSAPCPPGIAHSSGQQR